MLDFEWTFPHSYEISELGDLPGNGKFNVPVVYFVQTKGRPEPSGLWLKVRAASGKTWIGVFAFGYISSNSQVISSPDPSRLCVLSKGNGYIVSTEEPEVWEKIPLLPVLSVRPIPEQRLLVFSDFIRLAAYSIHGLAWESPRLCWDSLKITHVTKDTIEGTGYDPTNSTMHEMRFVVDLKTGRSLLPSPVSQDGKPVW